MTQHPSAKKSPLLTSAEKSELGFGLAILIALMVLLWENGFEKINETQVHLYYFRECMTVLVLSQIFSTICVLREQWDADNKKKPRWISLGIGGLLLGQLIANYAHHEFFQLKELENIFRISCLIFGAFPLLNLREYFFRSARKKNGMRIPKVSPALLFLLSLISAITIGGTLLLSPGATKEGIELSITDAYFISTSAVCVTGLVPINVHDYFTNYGQTILLFLFQIGAFGVMTFAYFVSLMVGQGLSLKSRVTFSNLLDEDGIAKVDRFINYIIGVTLGVEALGAIGLYFAWQDVPGLSGDTLIWYAVFHSVSAFCNAGFSLFESNLATPCIVGNIGGQSVIMLMVLCGSLGFALYMEIVHRSLIALKLAKRSSLPRHWSTYSWLVCRMTAILVIGGAIILFLISWLDGSLSASDSPWYRTLWESLFNAVARTAGFNISAIAYSSIPYIMFLGLLMFIGGNPGSTTGGVHTTAFAITCGEVARVLKGKKDVVFKNRSVTRSTVERALITILLAGTWVILITMIISFLEPEISLQKLFFEVISSFATVGFSLDVTPTLDAPAKWLLIFNMIVGRVGMVAFILAFMKPPARELIHYPSTHIPLN